MLRPRTLGGRAMIAVVAFLIALLLVLNGHRSRHGGGSWTGQQYSLGHHLDDDSLDSQAHFGDPGARNEALEKFLEEPKGLDLYTPVRPYNFMWMNEAKLRKLAVCQAEGNCPANALKFVVIGVYHCHLAVFDNYRGGEGLWCSHVIDSLERQGYTVLLAGEADWAYMAHLYRQFPDNIKVVLSEDGTIQNMEEKDYKRWLKRPDNPLGIPAWKFFRFSYFPNGRSTIVGEAWSVCGEPDFRDETAHDYRNFTYIGYALDPEDPEVVPFEKRPMQVYILAKRLEYFYPFLGHQMLTHSQVTELYHLLRKEFPTFEFVGAINDGRLPFEIEEQGPMTLPEGIRNLGKLGPDEWAAEVGKSRALMGIGFPYTSPSPYYALSRGVPFINPHMVDEHTDNDNHLTWYISQHEWLRILKPPEVYNVPELNVTAYYQAIKAALTTPMPARTLPHLRRAALDARVANWVEADWRHAAEVILADRKAGKETQEDTYTELFEL